MSTYLRRGGVGFLATALAVSMCVPGAALANSSGAGIVTSNGYGMNPNAEIGENTVPSATKGDTSFVLTSLYNSEGKRYIVGCCGGTGTASCDYLDVVGIDNIGSTGYNWGTKINENPNHFAWNDAVTDESTCTQVSGSATSASSGIGYVKSAWQGVMTYATVEKFLPDVLAAAGTSVQSYETIVDMIHDDAYEPYDASTIAEGATRDAYVKNSEGVYEKTTYNAEDMEKTYYQIKQDRNTSGGGPGGGAQTVTYADNANALKYAAYSPKIVNYEPDGNLALTVLTDAMWLEGAAAESVDGYGETAVTRYGDPTDIAQEYEGFIKGLQWYILSKHEANKTLKTVAYVTKYAEGEVSCIATNPKSNKNGYTAIRSYEGFEQISNNIALTGSTFTGTLPDNNTATYTTTSLDDFENVDFIFVGSNFDSSALKTALETKAKDDKWASTPKIVPVSLAIGNQGFGLSRNLIEYMSYMYPEDVQLSYALKYFWKHFGHVKDQYIDAVMVNQDSNKLLPTGDAQIDLDTSGYKENYINSRIIEGEKYYQANQDNANSNCSNYRLMATTPVMKTAGVEYDFNYFTKVAAENDANEPVAPKPAATKKAQTITAKNLSKTFKVKKLKKKVQSFKINVKASGGGKLTYKVTKKNAKVTFKNGKVTVKKGTKKGTYTVKVKVTAAAKGNFKSASKVITIKVKVAK